MSDFVMKYTDPDEIKKKMAEYFRVVAEVQSQSSRKSSNHIQPFKKKESVERMEPTKDDNSERDTLKSIAKLLSERRSRRIREGTGSRAAETEDSRSLQTSIFGSMMTTQKQKTGQKFVDVKDEGIYSTDQGNEEALSDENEVPITI